MCTGFLCVFVLLCIYVCIVYVFCVNPKCIRTCVHTYVGIHVVMLVFACVRMYVRIS